MQGTWFDSLVREHCTDAGQLSSYTTTTESTTLEPVLCNESHRNEKPAHRN